MSTRWRTLLTIPAFEMRNQPVSYKYSFDILGSSARCFPTSSTTSCELVSVSLSQGTLFRAMRPSHPRSQLGPWATRLRLRTLVDPPGASSSSGRTEVGEVLGTNWKFWLGAAGSPLGSELKKTSGNNLPSTPYWARDRRNPPQIQYIYIYIYLYIYISCRPKHARVSHRPMGKTLLGCTLQWTPATQQEQHESMPHAQIS